MKRAWAALLLCGLAGCPKEDPVGDIWGFISDFKASHYLTEAIRLQKLDETARVAALRELSRNSKRASDVYPLCRMLFEAKEGKEFRAPRLGAPGFVGTTNAADWPLEPITIHRGVPILVVTGYALFGLPEPPQAYLDYCLGACRWTTERFSPVDEDSRRRILKEFIKSHPKTEGPFDWLTAQAD